MGFEAWAWACLYIGVWFLGAVGMVLGLMGLDYLLFKGGKERARHCRTPLRNMLIVALVVTVTGVVLTRGLS